MQQMLLFPDMLQKGEYVIPAGAEVKTCASCGAEIVWALTTGGARMPLALATARDCAGQRVALTHFADCPQSQEWSKRS